MIALGQHAEFIIAAYVGVSLALAGLICWVVFDSVRTKARLTELGDKRP